MDYTNTKKNRILVYVLIFAFAGNILFPQSLYAQGVRDIGISMPPAGSLLDPSEQFTPPMIRGVHVFPENPLNFEFILDTGDQDYPQENLKKISSKLIKYFLASLTMPATDMWVNLSPYQKNRIISPEFGKTEMGRDLLSEDYILKQLTSSLMYPENKLGTQFWQRVYQKAYEKFHTTDIPFNTFNKVWIVPDSATVYEEEGTAYVVESHLKVMMEEDYEAQNNAKKTNANGRENVETIQNLSRDEDRTTPTIPSETLTTSIIREILLPEIQKEVNQGKNFAVLRQIYNAMILSTWYKQTLRQSILNKVYADQKKVKGIDTVKKEATETIYHQYLDAIHKGVFNYIREEYNPYDETIIPRKYFSGGFDAAMLSERIKTISSKILSSLPQRLQLKISNAVSGRKGKTFKIMTELIENSYEQLIEKAKVEKSNDLADPTVRRQMDALAEFVAKGGSTADFNRKALLNNLMLLEAFVHNWERVAIREPLTGLLTRRGFMKETLDYIDEISSLNNPERTRREDTLASFMLADIDGFNLINQVFGHAVGDEVLKGVSTGLTKISKDLSKVDMSWGRYGGEEFAGFIRKLGPRELVPFFKNLNAELQRNETDLFPSTLTNAQQVKAAFSKMWETMKQKEYSVEQLNKIKDGLIHQFIMQKITKKNGTPYSLVELNNMSVPELIKIASEKLSRLVITLSVGIREFNHRSINVNLPDAQIYAKLFSETDIAMYWSKNMKNHKDHKAISFSPEMSGDVISKDPQTIQDEVNLIISEPDFKQIIYPSEYLQLTKEELSEKLLMFAKNYLRIREIAEIDPVAGEGIFNRRGFLRALRKRSAAIKRNFNRRKYLYAEEDQRSNEEKRSTLTLVLGDLSNLKVVNDWKGHPMGDKLLRTFFQNAKKFLKKDSILSRYGGDEFEFCLFQSPTYGIDEITDLAKKLQTVPVFKVTAQEIRERAEKLEGESKQIFFNAVKMQLLVQGKNLGLDQETLKEIEEAENLEHLPYDLLKDWVIIFTAASINITTKNLNEKDDDPGIEKQLEPYRKKADQREAIVKAKHKNDPLSSPIIEHVEQYLPAAIASEESSALARINPTQPTEEKNDAKKDKAQVGGIDLNPELLNLQIKRDKNGIPLPLGEQPVGTMHIDGFYPVIIDITPLQTMPFKLGKRTHTLSSS